MARMILVSFIFPGVPKIKDLEPAFDYAGDWIRYSSNAWLIWTDKTTSQVHFIVEPFLDADDKILVAEILTREMSAYLPKWVLDWIASKYPDVDFVRGDDAHKRQRAEASLLPQLPKPPR